MNSLLQKNALVCGASKGIGKAVAIKLASDGASITLIARNETTLKETLKSLDSTKEQKHDFIIADFSNPTQLENIILNYLEKTGKQFQILINNTGGPSPGPIISASVDAFRLAFDIHVICSQILAKALFPGMKKSDYGRIINITSTSIKQPLEGLGVSNTIRAAMANWAKTWANEVAQFNITVNNILPGATDTERLRNLFLNKAAQTGKTAAEIILEAAESIPMKRFASPIEIADAVAFLASPSASYITGINLPVDGGRLGCL